MEKIWHRLSIVEKIEDEELKTKVKRAFEEGIRRGGWSEDDVFDIPFTLLIPNCPVNIIEHTAEVTGMALDNAERMAAAYDLSLIHI